MQWSSGPDAQDGRWISRHDAIIRNILRDHRARADRSSLSDGYTTENRGAAADAGATLDGGGYDLPVGVGL